MERDYWDGGQRIGQKWANAWKRYHSVNVPVWAGKVGIIPETLSEMLSFKSAYVDHEIIERFVSRIKVIGYDKYKWIINLSGKEFDEAKDMDSEIQITRVLSFEEARAWRKLSGDYVRNRQWNDIEVDIRII